MSKQFSVIVIDPPYEFGDKLKHSDVKRGACANYPTMSISEITTLPVKAIADPTGCLLALWVPSSLLQEGLDIMKAYGFQQKQTYIWVKTKKEPLKELRVNAIKFIKSACNIENESDFKLRDYLNDLNEVFSLHKLSNVLSFFMGHTFRQTHEICLIGINSNGIYKKLKNKSQRSVSFASNLKHSAKPEALQDSLEIMFPDANKIEIFARRERDGWTCLGNEVGTKEDIRESMKNL